MRTTITLPDDLFERAEAAARRMGISRSQLYRQALESFIQKDERAITDALNKLYGPGGENSRADPVMQVLSAKAILRSE
jgi:predicted DNA-binding protein